MLFDFIFESAVNVCTLLQVYKFKKLPMPAESGLQELSTKLFKFGVSIQKYALSFQEGSHSSR